jgi:hypothetical protein
MVVFEQDGKWWVRLQGRVSPPCMTKERAIRAAVETAEKAEGMGHTARVHVQNGPADFELLYPAPIRRPMPGPPQLSAELPTHKTQGDPQWQTIPKKPARRTRSA